MNLWHSKLDYDGPSSINGKLGFDSTSLEANVELRVLLRTLTHQAGLFGERPSFLLLPNIATSQSSSVAFQSVEHASIT